MTLLIVRPNLFPEIKNESFRYRKWWARTRHRVEAAPESARDADFLRSGNGGICDEAECVPVDVKNIDALVQAASRIQPDLTVVGPEVPLALGVVDEFRRRGFRIFGPTAAAARLESSKIFAKEFMQRHRIPTAHFAICTTPAEIKEALPHFGTPIVVKADGLAAGKGVVIAQSREEAAAVANEMLAGKMVGEAGARVVLEQYLEGEELSFLVVSDGERVVPLVAAQDHKRVGDNDTGPNTGGMGAYSTPKIVDPQMREWLLNHVARPVVNAMREEGATFTGILYCGLMMTARGPMVLEFNCRFGDPETQPILMRLESDLLGAFIASAEGRISDGDFKWSDDATVCVVLASRGYPDTPGVGEGDLGYRRSGEGGRREGLPCGHAQGEWRLRHQRGTGAGRNCTRCGSENSCVARLRGCGKD